MARRIVALGGLLRRALPAAAALSGGTVLHCTDDGPPRLDDHRALLKGGHDAAEAIDLDASEVQQQRPPQDLRKCDLTVDEDAPLWEAGLPNLSKAAVLTKEVTGLDVTNCGKIIEPAKKRLKPEAAPTVDNAFLKKLAEERAVREGRSAHSVPAPSASASAGGFGGVDPNLDPELATALRNSMEDGQAAADASEPVDTVAYADKDDYDEYGVEEEDDDDGPVFLKSTERDGTGPQAKIAATSRAFGPIKCEAAAAVAKEGGFTRPPLDTSDDVLRDNLRRIMEAAPARTETLLPAYFKELSEKNVVCAAKDLPPEALKKVKEKQTHWMTRGRLGQLSEQMKQSFRKALDALHHGSVRWHKDRVADGTHHFLAANRTRERGLGQQTFVDKDAAWTSYINSKKRIKAKIEAGDALSPLEKALAKRFKADDQEDFALGAARGELVVDAKQLVKSDVRIRVLEKVYTAAGTGMQEHPNRRYEETKGATTAKQFIDAGFKRGDLTYDIKKGFVKVLGEIPKRRKYATNRLTEEQKDAMAARYLKIIEEHQS